MTSSIFVWTLAAPLAAMTAGAAPQADVANLAPPTAIERALVERACASRPSAAFADAEAQQRCADGQLFLLRKDFGSDLRLLSSAERKALDAACSRLEVTHGRDGYLDCVNEQLLALRARRARAQTTGVSADDARARATANPVAAVASQDTAAAPRPGRAAIVTAGGILVALAAVASAVLVRLRKRRPRRICRDCGAPILDSGDLCATCRHAAAETQRRAATERLEQVRAEEAERRRKAQAEEEARRQQELAFSEAREAEQREAQRRFENARRQEEAQRRAAALEVARPAPPTAPRQDEAFDPYAVLGVPRDTTPEMIRAAYEQARSKYDLDNVAHLGVDVQEHFRDKAEAVDRAYHMLAR